MNPTSQFTMVAKTFFGLEDVLAAELAQFGAVNIDKSSRAVTFSGTREVLYRVNLCCRTALRILVPIKTFPVHDEHELYKTINKINWEDYMDVDDTLSVDGVVNSSALTHSKYVALKTKDAIVDRFREKYGRRPSVNTVSPVLRLNIRISKDMATLSLDSSGDVLYKRGYRSAVNVAPINEVLAAGLILLTGWDKKSPLIDPMCGSGTFPIEAALIAKNVPPGYLRKEYGFEKWKKFLAFDCKLWNEIKDAAFKKKTNRLNTIIMGSDIEPSAVKMANENIRNAKLSHEIEVTTTPFDQQLPPAGEGIVIMNPPYGERLKSADIDSLYTQIGDRLKSKYTGYSAWLITSNPDAAKHIGLKPSRKITIYNGALECKFLNFQMYKGSRKKEKGQEEGEDECSL